MFRFSKVEALDRMTEKLKVIYFAKYGFTFPLSGNSIFNFLLQFILKFFIPVM